MIDIYNKNAKIYNRAFDIVIVAGQSNAYGYGKGKVNYSKNKRIYELYRNGKYNTRENPKLPLKQFVYKCAGLHSVNRHLRKMSGFYLFFGKKYEKEMLESDRKLLFVRTAVGGTGFSDGCWGETDYLYLNTINMVKQIQNGNPKNRIVAVLWHQGETDVLGGVSKAYYQDKFKALIKGFRSEFDNPNLPFIAGDMVENWSKTQDNYGNIIGAVKDVISEFNDCALVSSKGLLANSEEDNIHFSGKSNEVLGERYFEAFQQICQGRNS